MQRSIRMFVPATKKVGNATKFRRSRKAARALVTHHQSLSSTPKQPQNWGSSGEYNIFSYLRKVGCRQSKYTHIATHISQGFFE